VKAALIVLELIVIAVGLVYLLGVWCVEWMRWRRER
jgi:hypothetical protein